MTIIRKKAEVEEKVERGKAKVNMYPSLRLSWEGERKKEVVIVKKRRKSIKVILMKSLKICWQRLKMQWEQMTYK